MNKFMKVFTLIEKIILASSMTCALFLTFLNVIGRFFFNYSLAFADELVLALFVLISLMGAALSAREKDGLIGLSLFTSRFSGRKKIIQKALTMIISVLYSLVLTWQGILRMLLSFRLGEHTFVMHLPRWIFWSFIPLCGICLIIHFIEGFYIFLGKYKNKETSL